MRLHLIEVESRSILIRDLEEVLVHARRTQELDYTEYKMCFKAIGLCQVFSIESCVEVGEEHYYKYQFNIKDWKHVCALLRNIFDKKNNQN